MTIVIEAETNKGIIKIVLNVFNLWIEKRLFKFNVLILSNIFFL